jgi:hypothetical protein
LSKIHMSNQKKVQEKGEHSEGKRVLYVVTTATDLALFRMKHTMEKKVTAL